MTTKFSFSKMLLLCAVTFASVSNTQAQVTIGADNAPQNFSVLELISGTNKGLRLPQLTTAERNTVQATAAFQAEKIGKALGLQIFNTDTHCVETWNGVEWISACGDTFSIMPKPSCASLDELPATVWAAYNLGADPAYDTPKKQIKKLTELSAVAIVGDAAVKTAYELDSTVFGVLYQWGRIKDGHQKRNSLSVDVASVSDGDYDPVTGQIVQGAGLGKHVYGNIAPYNWQENHTSWSQTKKDSLLGNGQAITYDWGSAAGGAVRNAAGTAFYQKPVRTNNDPCPSGWRVPTQDEWERLGAYGCGAADYAGGNFSTSANIATVPANNPNTTWVRVEGGKASVNTTWTAPDYDATGYAIYNSAVWTAADDTYKLGTAFLYADAAPEPLLFLPAAGWRNGHNSILRDVGGDGSYLCSTVGSSDFNGLEFVSSGVVPNSYRGRAGGFSVRCVAQ